MDINIRYTSIADYIFPEDTNPFAFDAKDKKPITKIAQDIDLELKQLGKKNLLIRGIQSGHHNTASREELIEKICKEGSDGYSETIDGRGVLFAAPYEGTSSLESTLAGFHEFKPKSEERPQYPIDIWMVFDKDAFTNIEYMHPRHNVIAKDKWQVKDTSHPGLMGILVIN